jgi:ribosomal protein S18 acetylase RimI-like enzyme
MADAAVEQPRAFKPLFQSVTCKASEVPSAARCSADTFLVANNPAFRHLFPTTAFCGCLRVNYRAALEYLFTKRLEMFVDAGLPVRIARDSETGEVLAVAAAVSPYVQLRPNLADLLSWPLRFGFESFKRLVTADDRMGKPPPGAWHISNVAVRPEAQGQGLGKRVMEMVIDDIKNEERRRSTMKEPGSAETYVHLHLDTQREASMEFYKKLGFEVTQIRDIPTGEASSFRSWTMEAKVPL